MLKKAGYLVGAVVAAFAVAPAANAAITIGVSVNGGAITTVATDGGTGQVNYNATVGGYIYNISAFGAPILSFADLLTQSVNIKNAGAQNALIDVYVTQSDISTPTSALLSTLTSNTIMGATATLTSYYSATNALFSGTELRSAVFNSSGVVAGSNQLALSGLYSETVKYSLNFTGGAGSNFNGTVNLAAVPEPAAWALFILGFGAIGGAMRRRSQQVSSAKAKLNFA